MGAGHCVVRLVACLVGRECTRESNVVRYVRYIESMSLHLYVIDCLIGSIVSLIQLSHRFSCLVSCLFNGALGLVIMLLCALD